MPIQYNCESCGKRLSITRRKAGVHVPCPVCGESTRVPEEQEEPVVTRDSPPLANELNDIADEPDSPTIEEPMTFAEAPASSPPPRTPPPIDDDDEPEFRMRRAETEFEEMDLTPMVDVTFLLLIFFMLTASFSLQKTIPTPVPDPNERSASQPVQVQEDLLDKSIMIEITGEDEIVLDDDPLPDPKFLPDRLIEAMNRDQKAEALVTVADRATQGTVVFVLDTANEVGMQKIRLAGRASDD